MYSAGAGTVMFGEPLGARARATLLATTLLGTTLRTAITLRTGITLMRALRIADVPAASGMLLGLTSSLARRPLVHGLLVHGLLVHRPRRLHRRHGVLRRPRMRHRTVRRLARCGVLCLHMSRRTRLLVHRRAMHLLVRCRAR